MTHSRKRGPFPQKSDCMLDLSADSVKSVAYAREKRLTLACHFPKLVLRVSFTHLPWFRDIGVYFSPVGKHEWSL